MKNSSENSVSIVLDERRAKANGLYPIKLRVYSSELQVKKLYSFVKRKKEQGEEGLTKVDFSKSEFKSVWHTEKTRKEHQEIKDELTAVLMKAKTIVKGINPFTFTEFELKFKRATGDNTNVIYQYNEIIKKLKANNKFSTASSYNDSINSLISFVETVKGKKPTKISFSEVTPDWLKNYETFMLSDLKRSKTTVGIYLRPLRAVFNSAINQKSISIESYPFGSGKSGKYAIPSPKNSKKALNKTELRRLFNADPETPEQIKAKYFWFFSYYANGMNVKDIALLKFENVKDNYFTFQRAKTIDTLKESIIITVHLNEFLLSVIKKYGNKNTDKNEYVFPILSNGDSEFEKYKKIKNFTKFINQNFKILALKKKIKSDVSTYHARHSFATNSIHNKASMEFVSQALGHNNLTTTQDYFKGFSNEDIIKHTPKHLKF